MGQSKSNSHTPIDEIRRNDLSPQLVLLDRRPCDLQSSEYRVRKIKKKHVEGVKASFERFGFSQPVLVRGYEVVDGHVRVEAARQLGLETIPCIDIQHLDDHEIRLLRVALNKIQEGGTWDGQALKLEFAYQLEFETDLSVTGFDICPTDNLLEIGGADVEADPVDDVGELPTSDALAVSQPGDRWRLGDHLILCGNARSAEDLDRLIGGSRVDLVFCDPPFNVPIAGHVSSSGCHPEFHEASGEMTPLEFEGFLRVTLGNAADRLPKGGPLYVFIDWRHMEAMSGALKRVGLEHIQLCIWAKDYPGMGSFYRSQHELIYVARKPGARHRNNIDLGAHGRNRSNVWRFAGATGGRADDADDFKSHPTVKPVRLILETLLDVTGAGEFVLDPFLGSGSTLLAAERTRRRCLGLEISPAYVDLAIRRWHDMTGASAVHVESGQTFAERAGERSEGVQSCEEGF